MASEMKFGNLRFVDERTNDLVTGFIREINPNSEITIPSLVSSSCILFYYLREYFTISGDRIAISDDKLTASTIRAQNFETNTVYGNVSINNKYNAIYSWSIQLLSYNDYTIEIGIDGSNKIYSNTDFAHKIRYSVYAGDEKEPNYYLFTSDAGKCCHKSEQAQTEIYGKQFRPPDIVGMELNVKERTLQFYVNNKSQGIAYSDIDFDGEHEYYLAICLCAHGSYHSAITGSCVKLIDFQCSYV